MTVDNNTNSNIVVDGDGEKFEAIQNDTTPSPSNNSSNNNNKTNILSKVTGNIFVMTVLFYGAALVWMLVMSNVDDRAGEKELLLYMLEQEFDRQQQHRVHEIKSDLGVLYHLEVLLLLMLCFSVGKNIIDNFQDGKDTKDGIKKPRSDNDDDTKIEEIVEKLRVITKAEKEAAKRDSDARAELLLQQQKPTPKPTKKKATSTTTTTTRRTTSKTRTKKKETKLEMKARYAAQDAARLEGATTAAAPAAHPTASTETGSEMKARKRSEMKARFRKDYAAKAASKKK